MTKRFYLPAREIHGDEVILQGKEAHHASRVMRLEAGDRLTLFDGEGHEYTGIIRTITPKEVAVSLEKRMEESRREALISVACALPKKVRMENVIEKMTEAGTEAILPMRTERTVPRVRKEEEAKKLDRFRRIAAEAAKQCGISKLPEISNFFSFLEVLRLSPNYDLALFMAPEGRPLSVALQKTSARRVIICVGPEGGWSEKEREEARKADWDLVSLGKRILKVDTACLAAVSILHYVLDPSACL
ncbi:MAG: RsmE family RNA methyltransferase [Candidatus Omnitrophota bacterium]